MRQKDKEFEELIWDTYGQSNVYDEVKYRLIYIRNIMLGRHESFDRLSVNLQYKYCVTIGIIVVQTARKDLSELSFSTNKEEIFDYAAHEGFTPPTSINIDENRELFEGSSVLTTKTTLATALAWWKHLILPERMTLFRKYHSSGLTSLLNLTQTDICRIHAAENGLRIER